MHNHFALLLAFTNTKQTYCARHVETDTITNQMTTIGKVPSWIDPRDFRHRARFSSHRATEGIAKYIMYGIGACVGFMGVTAIVGTIYEHFMATNLGEEDETIQVL